MIQLVQKPSKEKGQATEIKQEIPMANLVLSKSSLNNQFLKANSRDFKDAKSKLINIKSMPKIKFKYFIFICF